MENEEDKSVKKMVRERVFGWGEKWEKFWWDTSFLLGWVEPIIWGDFGVFRIILGLQLILHSFSWLFCDRLCWLLVIFIWTYYFFSYYSQLAILNSCGIGCSSNIFCLANLMRNVCVCVCVGGGDEKLPIYLHLLPTYVCAFFFPLNFNGKVSLIF